MNLLTVGIETKRSCNCKLQIQEISMRCQGNAWRRCQLRPESSDNESKAETLQKYKTISKNQEDVRRQQTERSQGMQRIPT